MLMTTVQIPVISTNESHMFMHISMINTGIILSRVFQKNILHPTREHGLIDHGNTGNKLVNVNGRSVSIMFRTEKIYNTNQ